MTSGSGTAQRFDPVEATREMVAIPSVNPALEEGGAGEAGLAAYVADRLSSWGYDVEVREVSPGRPNVVARLGVEGPALLLNGHLDTVGVRGMTVDPWGSDSTEERVVGRGSADMKSGLGCILAASRAWAAADPPRGRLLVALTADEEHASVGMQRFVESGVEAAAAVVTEPTSLAVMPAHKGFAWLRATVDGRAAHGSRPDVGVDSIRHAAALLQEMDALEVQLRHRPPHPLLGHGSFHAGTIRGGSAWSVYPDRCVLELERRTLPGEAAGGFLEEVRRCVERLEARLPEARVELELDLVRPPSEVPAEHPLVRGLLRTLSDRGHPARTEGMTAWVDAAWLNESGIPAVCFGPGSIAQAHAADEWVDAGEIRSAAGVLEDFVFRFLQPTA